MGAKGETTVPNDGNYHDPNAINNGIEVPAHNAKGEYSTPDNVTDNSIQNIRAGFGLFDGSGIQYPNSARWRAESIKNKQRMDDAHNRYQSAYLAYFNPQLEKQFNSAMDRARWTSVDRGTDGGSADQVRQRPVLDRFIQGKQKIASGADAGVNNLIDQEQQSRLRLEYKARNGLVPEYAVNDELRDVSRGYDRANAALGSQALGDFFGAGAGLYGDYQTAYGDAQGRQSGRRNISLFDGGAESEGTYQ